MSVDVSARPGAHAPRHRHTPRVRRLAAEAGVDLASVAGTGPSGRVTTDDVRRATLAADVETAEHVGQPRARSAEPAPAAGQPTSVVEVDVTTVLAQGRRLDTLLDAGDERFALTASLAKAAVEALVALPSLAGRGGRTVDLAVTRDGHPSAVVRDAGSLTLLGLARRLGHVDASADGTGATLTLADHGDRGTLWETPLLPPGQVAVLGAGAVVERPVVVRRPDGEAVVAIRSMAHLALTYDARSVDGADAARFLAAVKGRLERGTDPDLG